MIGAAEFCDELTMRHVDVVTGVPCGYLRGPISILSVHGRYIPAANEGAAIGIGSGIELAGRRSAVLIQNSGLGNALNPLTSLVLPSCIPLLVFMTLRGWPQPHDDEPQHATVGQTSHTILSALGVGHHTLGSSLSSLQEAFDRADHARQANAPFFILVPRLTIGRLPPTPAKVPYAGMSRRQAVHAIVDALGDALVFTTTGRISHEVFGARDRPENFYMLGSMGHAVALGLGTALARPRRRVAVLDGDGALLMHLGTLANVGAARPANLLHVVLDNRVYESTGGQPISTRAVPWGELALSLGYRWSETCATAGRLVEIADEARARRGPGMIVVQVQPDPASPRRDGTMPPPDVVSKRFHRAASADDVD
jgi:phosphonopyruvate decarboxylase